MDIMEMVKRIDEKAAHFPDGKIDYTSESVVAKFSVVVVSGGNVIVFKRSDNGLWEGITGYIDSLGGRF